MEIRKIEEEYRRIVGEDFRLPEYINPYDFANRFKPCSILQEVPVIIMSSSRGSVE